MALIRTSGNFTDLTKSLAPNNFLDFNGDSHAMPFTQTAAAWGGGVISCKGYSTLTYTPSGTSSVGVIGIKANGEMNTIRPIATATGATTINVAGYDLLDVLFGTTGGMNHVFSLS